MAQTISNFVGSFFSSHNSQKEGHMNHKSHHHQQQQQQQQQLQQQQQQQQQQKEKTVIVQQPQQQQQQQQQQQVKKLPHWTTRAPLIEVAYVTGFAQYAADNWFVTNPAIHQQQVNDIKDCMLLFEKFLQHWRMGAFFVPMLVYVDRYIIQVGRLAPVHMFDIFLVSSIVTLKVWEDKNYLNPTFAKMFSVPIKELNKNEVNFLNALDYDLSLTTEEKDQFFFSIIGCPSPRRNSIMATLA